MNRYRFSIEDIIGIVPEPLRKGFFKELLCCLLTPAFYVHESFAAFIESKNYRLSHSGQVYSLEQIIREYTGYRNCRITDGEYVEEVMVPYNGEGNLANYQLMVPSGVGIVPQVTVMYAGFGQILQNDFIVNLPTELHGSFDERGLRALIDEYKIAGKRYSIVYNQ